MILPTRSIVIAAFTGAFLLLLSPGAGAQGISRGTLVKQRDDLVAQRATLDQFAAQAKAGNILLIPTSSGVLPVATDEYRKIQEARLMVKGDDANNKAIRDRIDQDIAGKRKNSTAAIQMLTSDLNKEITTINKVIQTSNEVDGDGHRRTDTDRIAEDFLSADTSSGSNAKPSPKPAKRSDTDRAVDDFLNADTNSVSNTKPQTRNPNNLSPEELAESPAAPDAGSRTLTVDNTPPPPPDGTPIVDASAQPAPPRRGRDDNSDAIDGAEALVGIAVGVGSVIGNNNSHRGGNRPAGHPSPQPSPGHRGC